jgi:hypothetical protein
MKGTAGQMKKRLKMMLSSALSAGMLLSILVSAAIAGQVAPGPSTANATLPPNYNQPTPPFTAPPQPNPPPPGSGQWTQQDALIPGAQGNPTPPTSPGINNQVETNFPTQNSGDQTIYYIYHQQQSGYDYANGGQGATSIPRGLKMVMTLNQATIDPQIWQKLQGDLGLPAANGSTVSVVVTDDQLANANRDLAPYPGSSMETVGTQVNGTNQRIVILNDQPTPERNNPQPATDFDGTIPTVRTFSRYLVILGVVMATVWMALAAYGMTMGHPYAGMRVLGTAAGLICLLAAFTIYKIVLMNSYNGQPVDGPNPPPSDIVNHQPLINPVAPNSPPSLPPVPNNAGGRPARGGLPVAPLYGIGGR